MPIQQQEQIAAANRARFSDPNAANQIFQDPVDGEISFWWENWETEAPKALPGFLEQVRADIPAGWLNGPVSRAAYPDDFFIALQPPVVYLVSENPRDGKEIEGMQTLSEKLPGMELRTAIGVPNHGYQMVAPEPTARAIGQWLAENPIE